MRALPAQVRVWAGPDPEPTADALELIRLRTSAALAAPVVLLSLVPALQASGWQWLCLLLATPVVLWGAAPFHRSAWRCLRHGTSSTDTLVSVAVLSAYAWSLYALLLGRAGRLGAHRSFALTLHIDDGAGTTFLEAAVTVTTLMLMARLAESRARARAGAVLRELAARGSPEVVVLRGDDEHRVPADRIAPGERFAVRPGDTFAADGVVLVGTSSAVASPLTGDPVPMRIGPGSIVCAGTANLGGRLVVTATRVGADTQLAQTIQLLEQAQRGELAAQRLVARIIRVFVPMVLMIAVVTVLAWMHRGAGAGAAFTAGVAVLVVACPSALALVTPSALLASTGRGAQLGVLVRHTSALDDTRWIDTVVLHKAGVLTTGSPVLREVVPAPGAHGDTVLRLAAAVEKDCQHPVARGIVTGALDAGLLDAWPEVTSPSSARGIGVAGTVEGRRLRVGRPCRELPDWAAAAVSGAEALGRSAVLVWCDDRPCGVLVLEDPLRPTAPRAVAELRQRGLLPVLLTGDSESVALAVAAELGIDEVLAGVAPEDQVLAVLGLQVEGRVVAVIGDAVTDAAVLAEADLGVGLGVGGDVTASAGDLTLVRDDLLTAVDAIRLSRRTGGVIEVNLAWALAYNAVAIPLAADGLLHPLVAAAGAAVASVLVTLNSRRLSSFEPLR